MPYGCARASPKSACIGSGARDKYNVYSTRRGNLNEQQIVFLVYSRTVPGNLNEFKSHQACLAFGWVGGAWRAL